MQRHITRFTGGGFDFKLHTPLKLEPTENFAISMVFTGSLQNCCLSFRRTLANWWTFGICTQIFLRVCLHIGERVSFSRSREFDTIRPNFGLFILSRQYFRLASDSVALFLHRTSLQVITPLVFFMPVGSCATYPSRWQMECVAVYHRLFHFYSGVLTA